MSAAGNSLPDRNDRRIRLAQGADVKALAGLINIAFRVELPFIEGERINADGVREYMKKGKFLLAEDRVGLAGCVYIEVRGDRGYLGLLGVEPRRQGTGLGRKLMDAAENLSRAANCVAIDLRILSAYALACFLSPPRLRRNGNCAPSARRAGKSGVSFHFDVEIACLNSNIHSCKSFPGLKTKVRTCESGEYRK